MILFPFLLSFFREFSGRWFIQLSLVFLTYVAIAGVSYLIGSFPSAYLLVKWKTHQDIRKMGSGNVGALNSYEVTRSKFVGLSVLMIDMAKGALAVGLTRIFFGDSYLFLGLACLFSVAGHNYPIWLGFKGGRGLATAAGAVLQVNWFFVVLWCLWWLITYLLTRHIHVGNIAAILVSPFCAALLSGLMVDFGLLEDSDKGLFIIFVFLLCALLFLRHLQPLKDIIFRKAG